MESANAKEADPMLFYIDQVESDDVKKATSAISDIAYLAKRGVAMRDMAVRNGIFDKLSKVLKNNEIDSPIML